jgi:hypothetical protein
MINIKNAFRNAAIALGAAVSVATGIAFGAPAQAAPSPEPASPPTVTTPAIAAPTSFVDQMGNAFEQTRTILQTLVDFENKTITESKARETINAAVPTVSGFFQSQAEKEDDKKLLSLLKPLIANYLLTLNQKNPTLFSAENTKLIQDFAKANPATADTKNLIAAMGSASPQDAINSIKQMGGLTTAVRLGLSEVAISQITATNQSLAALVGANPPKADTAPISPAPQPSTPTTKPAASAAAVPSKPEPKLNTATIPTPPPRPAAAVPPVVPVAPPAPPAATGNPAADTAPTPKADEPKPVVATPSVPATPPKVEHSALTVEQPTVIGFFAGNQFVTGTSNLYGSLAPMGPRGGVTNVTPVFAKPTPSQKPAKNEKPSTSPLKPQPVGTTPVWYSSGKAKTLIPN